jgi:hypothetical protein
MLAAQGNYGQPGVMPAGYPYPHYMMPGYAPPPPAGKTGKGAAAAGEQPVKGSRKRRKRIPQGGPKKPATSFVLFSNTVREQVCSSRACIACNRPLCSLSPASSHDFNSPED